MPLPPAGGALTCIAPPAIPHMAPGRSVGVGVDIEAFAAVAVAAVAVAPVAAAAGVVSSSPRGHLRRARPCGSIGAGQFLTKVEHDCVL